MTRKTYTLPNGATVWYFARCWHARRADGTYRTWSTGKRGTGTKEAAFRWAQGG